MKHFLIHVTLWTILALPLNELYAAGNEKENINGSRVISGTVVDKISGESLPGAKIKIEGDSETYYADLDGSFNVPCPSAASGVKLVVSHVSYKNYEEQLEPSGGDCTLTVEMRR